MSIVFSLLLFFAVQFASAEAKEILRFWRITSSSFMEIEGTTNVNSFQCISVNNSGKDMIRERWTPEQDNWEIYGSVFVKVDFFDCQSRTMNNDFRNTLKYEQYPDIQIRFLSLREHNTSGNARKAKGWVEISLAGASHRYFLESELVYLDDQFSVLNGKQVFRFSDFGLEAPRKGLGLVRVNDEITVNFQLKMEQITYTEN